MIQKTDAIMFTLSLILPLQIGLKGEELDLSSGRSSQWISQSTLPKKQSLIWYKVKVNFVVLITNYAIITITVVQRV